MAFGSVMQSHTQRIEDAVSLQEGHDQLYALQTTSGVIWRCRFGGDNVIETGGRRFPRNPELDRREQHQVERQADERRHLLFIEGEGWERKGTSSPAGRW